MDRNELLRQLDILATYMPQWFSLDDELNSLKRRFFKPKKRIKELEKEKQKVMNIVFPYIDLVPRECLIPESITFIRDSVKYGRANSLYEALSLLQMKKQAEHDRYVELHMRAADWRRRYGN